MGKLFLVKVNNKSYNVEVEETLDTHSILKTKRPSPVTANIKKIGVKAKNESPVCIVKSPLPGLIVDIAVEVGKKITKGEKVLVLEAMKMENSILSPVSGTVDKISVKVGDSVNGNQEMVVITSN